MNRVLLARTAGVFYLIDILLGGASASLGSDGSLASTVSLAAAACYAVVTVLLYLLFAPVNRTMSLVAMCFSLIGCGYGVMVTFGFDPLHVSNLVFFGVYCLLIGYLIIRAPFMPSWLGFVMLVAGCGWLTFGVPAVGERLAPYNFAPGVIGESLLTLWLLIKGAATGSAAQRQQLSVGSPR